MDSQPAVQQDQEVLSQFHAYPWRTDLAFLKGLVALLGGVEKLRSDPTHVDLTLHARIFYYRKVRQVQVDFSAYKQWVGSSASNPIRSLDQEILSALYWASGRVAAAQTPPPQNPVHVVAAIAQQYALRGPAADAPAADRPSGLAWQQAAPTLDLCLDRDVGGAGGAENAAPYPTHFAELISAVRANKPVPGVREIPDTVVRDPEVKPVGRMTAPKKPWEVNIANAEQLGQGVLQDAGVDQDFPPLNHEIAPESNVSTSSTSSVAP